MLDRLPPSERAEVVNPYDYLVSLGTDAVDHADAGSNFLGHLSMTGALLGSWGCDDSTVHAGLYHSIYGSECMAGLAVAAALTPSVAANSGGLRRLLAADGAGRPRPGGPTHWGRG